MLPLSLYDRVRWVLSGFARESGNCDKFFDPWLELAIVLARSEFGVKAVEGSIEELLTSCAVDGGLRVVSCGVIVSSGVTKMDEGAASALIIASSCVCESVGKVDVFWVIV